MPKVCFYNTSFQPVAHQLLSGYNGFVDGSAYTSAWYAQPMPFYPTAMPYPQAYQYPTATIPTNRGGPRGRGRGRARGGASIRGNTGRGGSRTWVNPNIDANKYKYKAQSSASSSASTSNTAHGRGSANRVLVNKHTTAKPTPQAGPSTLKPEASSTGKSQRLKPGSTLVLNGITFTVGKSAKKLIRSSCALHASAGVCLL